MARGRGTLLAIVALTLVGATGGALAIRSTLQHAAAATDTARPTVPAPPQPRISSAELRFASDAAPGVWAELKVILDNPLPPSSAGPQHAVLLVPATLLEDYKLRGCEPMLVAAPQRRSDGRYALIFPAPLPQSLNWYRVELEARRARPRPLRLSLMLDRPLYETPSSTPRLFYADRDADPFMVVPENVVRWVPGAARGALPVLVLYTLAVTALIGAGCTVAFLAVRR